MAELYINEMRDVMIKVSIIKKLKNNKYRLYSKKKDKSGKRKNLGTFDSRSDAEKREKQVNFFKGQSADDQEVIDKDTQVLKLISDTARYLENSGMIEEANEMYALMDDVDNSMDGDNMDEQFYKNISYNNDNGKERATVSSGYTSGDKNVNENKEFDNLDEALEYFNSLNSEQAAHLEDAGMLTDTQRNVENQGSLSNEGFSQGTFSVPEATRLAELANKLDKLGLYSEADQVDDILLSMANESEDEENYEPTPAQIKEYNENIKFQQKLKKLKQFYNEGALDDLIKKNNVEGFIAEFLRMNPKNENSAGFISGIMVSMKAISPNEAGGNPEYYQDALYMWNNPDYEIEMDNVDMLAHSNGLQTSTNDATNNFNGLSDSYFYRSYDNLDNRYKISP